MTVRWTVRAADRSLLRAKLSPKVTDEVFYFTPLRGYTSSGAARHLPLKGKALPYSYSYRSR